MPCTSTRLGASAPRGVVDLVGQLHRRTVPHGLCGTEGSAARARARPGGGSAGPGHERAVAPGEVRHRADVGEPGGVGQRTRRRAWASPCSTTSRPPGASHEPAPATIVATSASPPSAARSASWGSQARTSSANSSGEDTYGGLATIAVTTPRSSSGSDEYQSLRTTRTRAPARPIPATLALATASASAERSTRVTCARGTSVATASPIAPDPVPRSITSNGPERRSSARRWSMTTWATSSVSGRGISTRRSTTSSSERNAHTPRAYCSGSPAARRPTIPSRNATAGR